jgi:hypothetical protein
MDGSNRLGAQRPNAALRQHGRDGLDFTISPPSHGKHRKSALQLGSGYSFIA